MPLFVTMVTGSLKKHRKKTCWYQQHPASLSQPLIRTLHLYYQPGTRITVMIIFTICGRRQVCFYLKDLFLTTHLENYYFQNFYTLINLDPSTFLCVQTKVNKLHRKKINISTAVFQKELCVTFCYNCYCKSNQIQELASVSCFYSNKNKHKK